LGGDSTPADPRFNSGLVPLRSRRRAFVRARRLSVAMVKIISMRGRRSGLYRLQRSRPNRGLVRAGYPCHRQKAKGRPEAAVS